ncbi:MAG: hypothetical protein M5U35_00150 [Roseovarius sp.]|nr:hypothetical protein [Roseovarius sp.]
MASKTTLNAKNLEALGAERLAELLIEVSTGNAAAKRKLRLALAGTQSPREAAREITKRLTSIARARSFITGRTARHWSPISKPSGAPSSSRSHPPIPMRR